MTQPRHIRLISRLRHWHRWLGPLAVLPLLWLAATGILLNHSDDLDLAERRLDAAWARLVYDLPEPALRGFEVSEHWLIQRDGRELFLDRAALGECKGALVGAEQLPDFIVGICSEELLLLDARGGVLERIGAAQGLPAPVAAGATRDGRLVLKLESGAVTADLEQLQFSPLAAFDRWRVSSEPPTELAAMLRAGAYDAISVERLLRDLHNGRLLGRAGVWLLDLAALLLGVLTLTGFWLWWRHRWH